ncbi:MAG: PEGA domain-containing protein [Proteobacteria bacterium]|nr:PEGA domain-containing protein [Pseudomonadota bacterium]
MRSKPISLILVFSFLFSVLRPDLLLAQGETEGAKKIFLAVLALECKKDPTPEECSVLSESLREQLLKTDRFRIVDRKNMEPILKEQSIQISDCTSEECVVKLGRLLGVEKMVFGSIGRLGDNYVIAIQLVNVETGETEKMASRRSKGPVGELITPIIEIALEIAGGRRFEPTAQLARPGKVETGSLEVKTNPPGSSIYLDASSVGVSPVKVPGIPVGNHSLTITRDGYSIISKGVIIEKDKAARVDEILIEQTGNLKVTSTPVQPARVLVDEQEKGETPLDVQGLKIGDHKIRVTHSDYEEFAGDFQVFYQQTTNVEAKMVGKPGKILITSTPPGAGVYLDGRNKGETTLSLEVPPGDHKIRIKKEGFEDQSKDITVSPNKPYNLDFVLTSIAAAAKPIPKKKESVGSDRAWYKKAWVWVLVAGVVGGGAYATYALTSREKNEGKVSYQW